MAALKKYKDYNIEFGPNDGHKWSREKLSETDDIAKEIVSKRSKEQKLKNQILSVRYRMEDYLQDENIDNDKMIKLDIWLKEYLIVLGLTQKRFAELIENKDHNLRKYLTGERRFSTSLAMKFAHFFHTPPDLWLRVQVKNDLLLLKKEKQTEEIYSKYDYEKLLETV